MLKPAGGKCDSDHFLVQALVKQKLVINKVNGNNRKKWDQKDLHNKEKMSEYRNKICTELNKRPEKQDVNGEWENIKDAIIKSASEVLKQNSSVKRNEWWDENYKNYVKRKSEA